MALKIIVCVKPVPASSSVSIDPVTKTVRREAGETVISTLDKHALELAAQLKKQTDCSVTILTMAPASAEMNVREALARGGDRAIILSDRAFAGGDTFATSYVLANGIRQLDGFDLILTGAFSDDGGTGQLAAQLAEWLHIPHLHNAESVELTNHGAHVTTHADNQTCRWDCCFPALITVGRKMNKPGPASVRNIVAAGRKELTIWSASDLPDQDRDYIGLHGSLTSNGETYPLDTARNSEITEGKPTELAKKILARISDAGICI